MEGNTSERKGGSASLQPQHMTDKARKLTEDIQEIMVKFQSACKEARTGEINSMVEQAVQLLKDLKDEFGSTSQASPIPVDSLQSLSEDMLHIVKQICDEQDDATSALADFSTLKPELDFQSQQLPVSASHQNNFETLEQHEHACPGFHEYNGSGTNGHSQAFTDSHFASQFDFNLDFDFDQLQFNDSNDVKLFGHDPAPNITPQVSPPPTAFLGPRCSLWECQRPAQGSDYCSLMHAELAVKEGEPGMNPVLRPGGIGLKDDRLFTALAAKMQGKHVGIPECHGAAIEKSPWNASKLFDLGLLEGETIREWLFFDKPRRAFESGSRKQRSLSDYKGRGWHESRKQVMKELGGHKRSYYMDPQPPGRFEWHLYEFQMHGFDECALYKLELKLVNEKSPKGLKLVAENGKAGKDPLVDLQKQMGRLTADGSAESKQPVKGKAKGEKISDLG